MRVATLLPSATEIVAALGAADDIVAISHSCDFPSSVNARPRVTTTSIPTDAHSSTIDAVVREQLAAGQSLYFLDVERLAALRPDVIVSQRLCDVCAVASGDVLQAMDDLPGRPELIDLNPATLADVFDDIQNVAAALARTDDAKALLADLTRRRDAIASRTSGSSSRPNVVFLEWIYPPFSGGHWNPELVHLAGGQDVLGVVGKPSRTLTWDEIAAADPDVLFVAVCGYDAQRAKQDLDALPAESPYANLRAVREGRVHVANGDAFFARPGPRLIDGLEQLAAALHPEIFPANACPVAKI